LLPVNQPDGAIMIFAHQGGWDEMLLVLGPIAVIFALLRLAQRRAHEQQRRRLDDSQPPSPATQSTTTPMPNE
jgi:predicted LPLAT superfamily acyltransferase